MPYLNQPPTEKQCRHCGGAFVAASNYRFCSVICRLLDKTVKTPSGCIEWTGAKNRKGYGTLARTKDVQSQMAHRSMWQCINGPIPEGAVIMHSCDNPPCVNIEHLELGTHKQNMRDGVARKRFPRGESRPTAKLTEDDVRFIRKACAERTHTHRQLGEIYGLHHKYVSKLSRRIKWAWLD